MFNPYFWSLSQRWPWTTSEASRCPLPGLSKTCLRFLHRFYLLAPEQHISLAYLSFHLPREIKVTTTLLWAACPNFGEMGRGGHWSALSLADQGHRPRPRPCRAGSTKGLRGQVREDPAHCSPQSSRLSGQNSRYREPVNSAGLRERRSA